MTHPFAIKNGQTIPTSEANVSVYNKSWFFDFSVYSNIKVLNGKMFLPQMGVEKLMASAKIIGLKHPFTPAEILQWGQTLVEKNQLKDALIRILLVGPEQDSEALLFMFAVGITFYPDKMYRDGAKLITYRGERFLPLAKTNNLLLNYIGYREAMAQGALDALLIDNDGNIREGTRTTFFAIKDNILYAPPQSKVLPGMTHEIILKIAPEIIEVREADIPLANIADYDGWIVTGTSTNIMPVRQIDDITIKGGQIIEPIKKLQKLYKEYCQKQ